MTDALLSTLLPALDIVAFKRTDDGAFRAMAPPPAWFPQLADDTFPFLGHILEEANQFWRSRAAGMREYGPCAEVDESGREFHYHVKALTIAGTGDQYLIFELDRGSDRLRDTLQKVREQTLVAEQARSRQGRTATELRRVGVEIRELLSHLTAASGAQVHLVRTLRAKCDALIAMVNTIAD